MGRRAPFSETTRKLLWALALSRISTSPWSREATDTVSPVSSATWRMGSAAASRMFQFRLTAQPYSKRRMPRRYLPSSSDCSTTAL